MSFSAIRFGYHAQITLKGPHPGQAPINESSMFTTLDFSKKVLGNIVEGVSQQLYKTPIKLRWTDYHGTLTPEGTQVSRIQLINYRSNGADPVLYGTADSKGRINIIALDTKAPESYSDRFVSTAVSRELSQPTFPYDKTTFLEKMNHWFVDRLDNLKDAIIQGEGLKNGADLDAANARLIKSYNLK